MIVLHFIGFVNIHSNQVEKHYPDGKKEITFPDKSTKYIYPNGEEMSVFKDGSIQKRASDGTTSIEYPNGQREIHTAEYKVAKDNHE